MFDFDLVRQFLFFALKLYSYLLLGRIIMSWFSVDWYSMPWRILHDLTEPVLGPFRKLIPPIGGMDFSPMIVFMVIQVLQMVLAGPY